MAALLMRMSSLPWVWVMEDTAWAMWESLWTSRVSSSMVPARLRDCRSASAMVPFWGVREQRSTW